MDTALSLVLGLVIVIVVLVAAAYVWWHHTGWHGFHFSSASFTSGPITPAWKPKSGSKVSSLRFKDCIFTVVDPHGTKHTKDVSAVLNGMAVAYRGAKAQPPPVLALDRALNAFSFRIPGVNDKATVSTKEAARAWRGSATTLTGMVRTI